MTAGDPETPLASSAPVGPFDLTVDTKNLELQTRPDLRILPPSLLFGGAVALIAAV